jgi:hypothetical protein
LLPPVRKQAANNIFQPAALPPLRAPLKIFASGIGLAFVGVLLLMPLFVGLILPSGDPVE